MKLESRRFVQELDLQISVAVKLALPREFAGTLPSVTPASKL